MLPLELGGTESLGLVGLLGVELLGLLGLLELLGLLLEGLDELEVPVLALQPPEQPAKPTAITRHIEINSAIIRLLFIGLSPVLPEFGVCA